MKIVCISDTHGMHRQFKMPKGDILVHAGDFTHTGEYSIIQDFNSWLGELDYSYKIIIAGNHELTFEKYPFPTRNLITNGIYLQDSEVVIEGYKFYGSPWTLNFNNWAFNMSESAIQKIWALIPKDTDVLITHGPAFGILDSSFDWDYGDFPNLGDTALLHYIKEIKPKYHICGHIHQAYGVFKTDSTTFINASQYKAKAKPIVVKL